MLNHFRVEKNPNQQLLDSENLRRPSKPTPHRFMKTADHVPDQLQQPKEKIRAFKPEAAGYNQTSAKKSTSTQIYK